MLIRIMKFDPNQNQEPSSFSQNFRFVNVSKSELRTPGDVLNQTFKKF